MTEFSYDEYNTNSYIEYRNNPYKEENPFKYKMTLAKSDNSEKMNYDKVHFISTKFQMHFPQRLSSALINPEGAFTKILQSRTPHDDFLNLYPFNVVNHILSVKESVIKHHNEIDINQIKDDNIINVIKDIRNMEIPIYDDRVINISEKLLPKIMDIEEKMILDTLENGQLLIRSIFLDCNILIRLLTKFKMTYPIYETIHNKDHELYSTTNEKCFFRVYDDFHSKLHIYNDLIFYFYGQSVIVKKSKSFYIVPMEYVDYLITLIETDRNLKYIVQVTEYSWLEPLANYFYKMIAYITDHNILVTYFSLYESLCLFMIDTLHSTNFSWAPIIETVDKLIEINNNHFPRECNPVLIYAKLQSVELKDKDGSALCSLIDILQGFTSGQLAEVSSLHKFIFYAEVNEVMGVEKFIKRTHTKRKVDKNAIISLVGRMEKEFIINYYKKHKILPNIKGDELKITKIRDMITHGEFNMYEITPCSWFYDVYVYKSLTMMKTGNAIEFAKDKASTLEMIDYSINCATKEIIDVIKTPNYNTNNMDLLKFSKRRDQEYIISSILAAPYPFSMAARLCPKEREQKIEARLFGCAITRQKHKMSEFMAKSKKVLSYFDGQIMTPSDEERKKAIHNASQLLTKDGLFCIMSDIEGHNQSMQYHNTGELLKRIGLIYGEENWENLVNVFNQQEVFYTQKYRNITHISRGQLGGIEGWCNPVWTLHTCLLLKEIVLELNLSVKDLQVYSDDTSLIVDLGNISPEQINKMYREINQCASKYGMILKATQTIISPRRITMLRNHYVDGKRSDTTLKKLLALTQFNLNILASEELEVESICSTISSAMEFTNHPLTCTIMKWAIILPLTIRSFITSMDKKYEDISKMIIFKYMEPSDYKILYPMVGQPDENIIKHTIAEAIRYVEDSPFLLKSLQECNKDLTVYKKVADILVNNNFMRDLEFKRSDILFHLIKNSEALFIQFLMRLLLPEQLGGLNIPTMISMSVTGSSCRFRETLHLLLIFSKKYLETKSYEFVCDIISNSYATSSKQDESKFNKLINTPYPVFNNTTSITGKLKNYIKSIFKENNCNSALTKLIDLDNDRREYNEVLFKIFEKRYTPRIVSYYSDHSMFNILNLIVSKVQTSSSLLGRSNQLYPLRKQLSKLTISNQRSLTDISENKLIDLLHSGNIDEYITMMRGNEFPNVDFIDIDEVPPCSSIFRTHQGDPALVGYKSVDHYSQGEILNNLNIYGSSAGFKMKQIFEDNNIRSYQTIFAINNLFITKWIIINSNKIRENKLIKSDLSKTNVVQACNLNLKTLINDTYQNLEKYIPSVGTGEILHRIENFKFRHKASIRCLINEVNKHSVFIDQKTINKFRWEDANIHFDYFRLYLLYKLSYNRVYYNQQQMIMNFEISNVNSIINDVRKDFLYINEMDQPNIESNYYDVYNIEEIRESLKRFLPSIANQEVVEDALPIQNSLMNESSIGQIIYLICLKNDRALVPGFANYCNEDIFNDIIKYLTVSSDLKFSGIYKTDYNRLTDYLGAFLEERKRKEKSLGLESYDIELIKEDLMLSFDDIMETMNKQRRNLNRCHKFKCQLFSYIFKKKKDNDFVMPENLIKKIKHNAKGKYLIKLDVLIYFIIKYCLRIKIINGKIRLQSADVRDRIKSETLYLHYGKRDDLDTAIFLSLEFSFFYLFEDKMIDLVIGKIIEKINVMNVDNYIKLNDTNMINLDYQEEYNIDDLPSTSLTISQYNIDANIFFDFNSFKVFTEWRRELIDLYANPDVSSSPTGSDTYIIAQTLIDSLTKNHNLASKSVCDLCAGRGDFNLALRKSGHCNFVSYSKYDIFTKYYRSKEIIINKNYDVTDTTSIEFAFIFDIIIIDISFIRGNKDFTDLITTLCKNDKEFIIRLNSIEYCGEVNKEMFCKYQLLLFMLDSGENTHNNIYLFFKLTTFKIIYETEISLVNNYWFKSIVKKMLKLINHENLYIEGNSEIGNSITKYFAKDLNSNKILDQFDKEKCYGKAYSSYRKLQKYYPWFEYLPVTEFDNHIINTCELESNNDCYRFYYDELEKSIISMKKNNKRVNDSRISKLSRYKNDKSIIKFKHLNQLTISDIIKLRRSNNIKAYKEIFDSIILAHDDNINFTTIEFSQIRHKIDDEVSLLEISDMLPHSAIMKELIKIILISVGKSSFKYGIDMLQILIRSGEGRKKYKKLLGMYRKCKIIFKRLEETFTFESFDKVNRLSINYSKSKIKNCNHVEIIKPSIAEPHELDSLIAQIAGLITMESLTHNTDRIVINDDFIEIEHGDRDNEGITAAVMSAFAMFEGRELEMDDDFYDDYDAYE